jgi:YjjG family noncanonical pyrimidine nucleotidase
VPTRYPWLLFDADDTLFDYASAEATALRGAFEAEGVTFRPAWLPVYRRVNARAWRDLEDGRVTAARLRVRRFEQLFAELGVGLDPVAFGGAYLGQLAMQAQLVEGALEVLEALLADHRLAIVTNGLAEVQRPRLARSPLAPLVDHLVISEEVGAAKPDPAIFAAVLARLGGPDRRDVLLIGDSLRSDIAGGVASGLDTCWFNPAGVARPDGPRPSYEIRRLADLPAIVDG